MNLILRTILFFLNLSFITSKPFKRENLGIPATCQACYPTDPEKINVHLVPHSHDDVGWLKTVDQYYYGSKKAIQYAGVQYIIGSSIQALKGHPHRRYIQVESAFFWKWWQDQEEALKNEVIDLVNNGQLEIINGAWSMNDEAASHYHSTIDQFTWGFRFLNDTIGSCARPKVGWQIDPFGHSREQASILTQLGFQGLVIGRLDYRDKNKRKADKNLDFIWKGSNNLNNSEIFTTIFPEFYLSPDGYCFDVLCSFEPINDNEKSPGYNLKEKVNGFARKMDQFKTYYKTSNIMVPMGGDFNYQAAEINFSNMDKLIKGFEGHSEYNVFYSTPSCYIKAVNEEVNQKSLTLTKKTDDFFPYASEAHGYWTGYFTSRPTSKRFERVGNNILQATKQLNTFSRVNGKDRENSLNSLREVMGIMQHHDAITGTEKEAVAKDYARLITEAIKEAEAPIGVIMGDLLKKDTHNKIDLKLSTCLLANVSICETTKKDRFIIAVYNPLSRAVTHYVRLPVDETNFVITGPDGEEKYDVLEPISKFDYIKEHSKPSTKELVFAASNIPSLGIKIYYVEKTNQDEENFLPWGRLSDGDTFGTDTNGFTIDYSTGKLNSVTINGLKLHITQDFLYYQGSSGGNGRASGAYIFHPKDSEAKSIEPGKIEVKAVKGQLVDEVLQVFNSEVSQIIRVYKGGESYIEFDWFVGNLKVDSSVGREIITRFGVKDFNNNGVFYTDSNGREQMRRQLNFRSDYSYNSADDPVSSNYYPVTSKIVIKDETKNLEVAILNDRAQGGSSLSGGTIELMLHRKLVRDDGLGVGEALREEEYGQGLHARGQLYLMFGPITSDVKSTAAIERDFAHKKLLAPWVTVGDATEPQIDSLEKAAKLIYFEYLGLTRPLPENVQILTLEPWRDNTYLLRLEHTLEKDEDVNLSKPIVVDIEYLFSEFLINEIGETTLGANQWLDDYENEEKLLWGDSLPVPWTKLDVDHPLKIELHPMQIRTFVMKVSKR